LTPSNAAMIAVPISFLQILFIPFLLVLFSL
jgi:hypothetical protein